jgi:hypothetical protein
VMDHPVRLCLWKKSGQVGVILLEKRTKPLCEYESQLSLNGHYIYIFPIVPVDILRRFELFVFSALCYCVCYHEADCQKPRFCQACKKYLLESIFLGTKQKLLYELNFVHSE